MGTINGLIFYANIVRANTAIFFPDWQDSWHIPQLVHSMAQPWCGNWNMVLWWPWCLHENIAPICLSFVHLVPGNSKSIYTLGNSHHHFKQIATQKEQQDSLESMKFKFWPPCFSCHMLNYFMRPSLRFSQHAYLTMYGNYIWWKRHLSWMLKVYILSTA